MQDQWQGKKTKQLSPSIEVSLTPNYKLEEECNMHSSFSQCQHQTYVGQSHRAVLLSLIPLTFFLGCSECGPQVMLGVICAHSRNTYAVFAVVHASNKIQHVAMWVAFGTEHHFKYLVFRGTVKPTAIT